MKTTCGFLITVHGEGSEGSLPRFLSRSPGLGVLVPTGGWGVHGVLGCYGCAACESAWMGPLGWGAPLAQLLENSLAVFLAASPTLKGT